MHEIWNFQTSTNKLRDKLCPRGKRNNVIGISLDTQGYCGVDNW